jgi:type IV secretory pathway VirB2 component (pilin)
MKKQELILDIIGIILIGISLYGFYFLGTDFWQSTAIGIFGLSLFVFKGSQIRKMIEKLFNKKTGV